MFLLLVILEAGAEDINSDEGVFEITTEPSLLYEVKDALEKAGYKILSAEEDKIPDSYEYGSWYAPGQLCLYKIEK